VIDTRTALEVAIQLLTASPHAEHRQAARRLTEVRMQRGMADTAPGEPDTLPEFIDVMIDG